MTTKIPAAVSKWEVAGIPAAIFLEVLYEMETLPAALKADLPRYMLLAFILTALVRGYLQKQKAPTIVETPAAVTPAADVSQPVGDDPDAA